MNTALVSENPNDTEQTGIHIKSFMEVLAEKKLRQMEEAKSQTAESMNNKQNAQDKTHNMPAYVKLKLGGCEAQQAVASGKKCASERVHVKTLEEIKREKALRQQKVENAKKATSEAEPFRGRRIRLGAKTNDMKEDQPKMEPSVPATPQTSHEDLNQTCLDLRTNDPNPGVLVKSFEEIMREKRQRKQQEAANQLIKEQALLEPSPVDSDSAKGNSHTASTTATEEPVKASGLLQKRRQHSARGRNKNLPLGKRDVSSSLKASPALPVQAQQSSRLRSLKLSPPAKPLEPSSLMSPEQPISLENPCHPSTPKKLQHSSLPARTQNPVLLPLRSQQLSSQVNPRQPTSPIKPLQSSLKVQPQESSSPLIFPQFSTQASFSQPSTPVKALHPSSQVQDQTFPITTPQPGMLELQQPSKLQTQQLPRVVPNDLSETEIVQEKDILITEESSTIDKTGQATKKGKGKPKASIKPSIGKKPALPKGPQKRKGAKNDHAVVAAVKPLIPSTSTMLSEPPAKKAAQAIDSSKEAVQSPKTCLEILAESVDSKDTQQMVPVPITEMGSSEILPSPAKIRRTSSSAPKTPLPAEDEFEKLMWELSGGHLEEAEIDLDAGKDEDDLLLELSEMIGS